MGTCCSASRRKSQKLDPKTYITSLSDVTAIVDCCIDKIAVNIKRYEIIDALAIFSNGIYSYLLKTQEIILSGNEKTENKEELSEGFDDEALFELKLALEKLKEDLISQNFLFDSGEKQLTMKKILHIEFCLKHLYTQLEKINPLSAHPYLLGDFQKGFEFLLSKNIIPSNYLEKEIREIIQRNETKNAFKCGKCLKEFKLIPPSEENNGTYICCLCSDCLLISKGYFLCETCDLKACLLCNSFGIKANCPTCKGKLEFRKDLANLENYHSTGLFRCNICGATPKVEEGSHHCNKSECDYDVCINCRSKMAPQLNIKLSIENQRWWKNQWTDCPLLFGERGKIINEKGDIYLAEEEENIGNYSWEEEWQNEGKKKTDPDNWEYSITWGNKFGDDKEGCYVRRRVSIKKSEKSLLEHK